LILYFKDDKHKLIGLVGVTGGGDTIINVINLQPLLFA